MINEELTRRTFLQGSSTLVGSTLLKVGMPALVAVSQAACSARDQGAKFENIIDTEAHEFLAIASRIFPSTDTPGAREAGVIWFFDKTYGSIFAEHLASDRIMLADFQAGVAAAYPGAKLFSDLDDSDQDSYLRRHQDSEFFESMRFKTLAGVFAMNTWGGNQDDIGWKLVGMDGPPHAWSPPFGYYDAEYMKERQDGE